MSNQYDQNTFNAIMNIIANKKQDIQQMANDPSLGTHFREKMRNTLSVISDLEFLITYDLGGQNV
jgi:hypothetical protein